MIQVKVKYYGVIRDVTRAPAAEFQLPDDATLSDLLDQMRQRYGQDFAERVLDHRIGVRSYVKLFLNDEEVGANALKTTKLSTGGPSPEATLYVMPGSTGGQ